MAVYMQGPREVEEAAEQAEGHRYPLRDRHAIQRQPFNVPQDLHRYPRWGPLAYTSS